MRIGFGCGQGFAFRGSSPPWPYVGRGRGGLPRCAYPGIFDFVGNATPSPMSQEQELEFLREEAKAVKSRLEEIESRMKSLEK